MRKGVLIIVVLGITATMLVAADYFGLFGVRRFWTRDFLSIRFLPVDAQTGKPIAGVHIKCALGGGAHDARPCTQRGDAADGVVLAQFVLARQAKRTWLFDRGKMPAADLHGQVTVVFIHPDYQRLFMPLQYSELPGMQRRDNKVELIHAGDGAAEEER